MGTCEEEDRKKEGRKSGDVVEGRGLDTMRLAEEDRAQGMDCYFRPWTIASLQKKTSIINEM